MIAAIYARRSTEQDDVADSEKSVTRQEGGARAFIAMKGWTLDEAHVYTDDGVSGAFFTNRAQFQRMMQDAASGAFQVLVLFDLDRFGRDGHKTMVALNALADLGVTVWDYSTGSAIDLDSSEGRIVTGLRAEFAQQYREKVRKHTRDALRSKASQGLVAGGRVFGYTNVRVGKGEVRRVVNEAEAAVVRDIYEQFAAGDGAYSIADSLNKRGIPCPRAQNGRPSGWSVSTLRAVLKRELYRGTNTYGKTTKAYGRELGPAAAKRKREKGQRKKDPSTWIRVELPELRIISPDLAARVDARRTDRRERYLASIAKGGHVPERAHGRYLLSGGLLICPTCGGHFEARMAPWQGIHGGVYICSTRRRKPGVCRNIYAIPIAEADNIVLTMAARELLSRSVVKDLLRLVDSASRDPQLVPNLMAQRERLQNEVANLVKLVAGGLALDVAGAEIQKREDEIRRIDVDLASARSKAPPNLDRLRDALLQRTSEWKSELRKEPKAANLVLRRLIEPLTIPAKHPENPNRPSFIPPGDRTGVDDWEDEVLWQAQPKPQALLEGLVEGSEKRTDSGTSPAGTVTQRIPIYRVFRAA